MKGIVWEKAHSVKSMRADQMKACKSPSSESSKGLSARIPISGHLSKQKSAS